MPDGVELIAAERKRLPTTTEIVYRWPDGREEVRYRRPYMSAGARDLMVEVGVLRKLNGDKCPYFVRHV
jgi:hypothetical protein